MFGVLSKVGEVGYGFGSRVFSWFGRSSAAIASSRVGRAALITEEVVTIGHIAYELTTADLEDISWGWMAAEILGGAVGGYSLFADGKGKKNLKDTLDIFSKAKKVTPSGKRFWKSPLSNKFAGFTKMSDTEFAASYFSNGKLRGVGVKLKDDGIEINGRKIPMSKKRMAAYGSGILASAAGLIYVFALIDDENKEELKRVIRDCELHLDNFFDFGRNAYDTIYHYESRQLSSPMARLGAFKERDVLYENARAASEILEVALKAEHSPGEFGTLYSTFVEHTRGEQPSLSDEARDLIAEAFPESKAAAEKKEEDANSAPKIEESLPKSPKVKGASKVIPANTDVSGVTGGAVTGLVSANNYNKLYAIADLG